MISKETIIALDPEILITEIAPRPFGVANAMIVSWLIIKFL